MVWFESLRETSPSSSDSPFTGGDKEEGRNQRGSGEWAGVAWLITIHPHCGRPEETKEHRPRHQKLCVCMRGGERERKTASQMVVYVWWVSKDSVAWQSALIWYVLMCHPKVWQCRLLPLEEIRFLWNCTIIYLSLLSGFPSHHVICLSCMCFCFCDAIYHEVTQSRGPSQEPAPCCLDFKSPKLRLNKLFLSLSLPPLPLSPSISLFPHLLWWLETV